MVGLFVRPRDTGRPTRMIAIRARAKRRTNRRRFAGSAYRGLSLGITRRISSPRAVGGVVHSTPGVLGRCRHEGCAKSAAMRAVRSAGGISVETERFAALRTDRRSPAGSRVRRRSVEGGPDALSQGRRFQVPAGVDRQSLHSAYTSRISTNESGLA